MNESRPSLQATRTVAIIVLLAVWPVSALAQPVKPSPDPAVKTAAAWLRLVDQGDYAQSWAEASSYFRGVVPQDKWVAMVTKVRKPLGAVTTRELILTRHETSLPDAPPGDYFVIQYKSQFAHSAMIETVTLMLDKDGRYHVAGYFIR
jgi:Protein of unknown function (DUF4019)